MLILVGTPFGRRGHDGIVAAGLPVAIARSAVKAGAAVQLVGTVGEGSDGDAVVLSVAAAGIGHAALLRGAVPVPIEDVEDSEIELERSVDRVAELEAEIDGEIAPAVPEPIGALEAADIALALRYLPDYRVVVVGQLLAADALAAVVEAARWAEARLVVVTADGSQPAGLPGDATVLAAPTEDAEGAFAGLVGRYAAALDRGIEPGEAFASASAEAGWLAVEAGP